MCFFVVFEVHVPVSFTAWIMHVLSPFPEFKNVSKPNFLPNFLSLIIFIMKLQVHVPQKPQKKHIAIFSLKKGKKTKII